MKTDLELIDGLLKLCADVRQIYTDKNMESEFDKKFIDAILGKFIEPSCGSIDEYISQYDYEIQK